MKQHVITVLVLNKSGVLARVTALFARRGFNIDSLVVCSTENDRYSRMTIVVTADDEILPQIVKQLAKLIDVKKITEIDPNNAVLRELLMIKLTITPAQRPEIESMCNIYKAKIIDLSPESVVMELTGEAPKLDAFVGLVSSYGILELTRTGLSALHRGKENINNLNTDD